VSARANGKSRNDLGRGGRTSPRAREGQRDALAMLEDRTYDTYRARLQTANRMRVRGQLWNLPLVGSALVTVLVALVALYAPNVYSDRTDVLLTILSVLTLVVSSIVSTANYAVNSERLFNAYRGLQRLSADIERENLRLKSSRRRNSLAARASLEYQEILDRTQNHSGADYWRMIRERNASRRAQGDSRIVSIPVGARFALAASWCLTALPVGLTIALIPLAAPGVGWMLGG